MLSFRNRVACSALSALLAAGIVAFADPANAVPIGEGGRAVDHRAPAGVIAAAPAIDRTDG